MKSSAMFQSKQISPTAADAAGKGDLLNSCIDDWSNDGMAGLSVPYGPQQK